MRPSISLPFGDDGGQAMPTPETPERMASTARGTPRPHISDQVPPTESEWLRHRSTIKRLYLNEHRPLKEVMDIMKRDHGLNAMMKSYKRRLRQWGYSKNITLRKPEADRLFQVLASLDKEVRLENGVMVSRDQLARHLRRKHGTIESMRIRARVYQQRSPAVTVMSAPDTYQNPEAILNLVRTYLCGRWGDKVSTAEQLDTLLEKNRGSSQLQILGTGVVDALEQQRLGDAVQLMKQAPGLLTDGIQRQSLGFLINLFRFIMIFLRADLSRRPETAHFAALIQPLMRFGAGLTAQGDLLPSRHPIRQLLHHLSKTDKADLDSVLRQAMRVACESWEIIVPNSGCIYHFVMWTLYGMEVGFENMPRHIEPRLRKTTKEYDEAYGEHNLRALRMKSMYSWYLHYTDIANGRDPYMNSTNLAMREFIYRWSTPLERLDDSQWLAKASKARGERQSAEMYMRETIEYMLEDQGWSAAALGNAVLLEDWFREWGDDNKAAGLAQWRERLFQGWVLEKTATGKLHMKPSGSQARA